MAIRQAPPVAGDRRGDLGIAAELLEDLGDDAELLDHQPAGARRVEQLGVVAQVLEQLGGDPVMPRCYFLPGFMGSELTLNSPRGDVLWLSYPRLAIGQGELLRLDALGLGPALPGRPYLFAGAPLEDYYASALLQLGIQLFPQGHNVIPWGFDWRLDLRNVGQQLALAIVNDGVSQKEPCSIVGHSQGGLVARVAWYTLGQLGCQSYCRRIVTLGAPHYGTWAAVQCLLGIEPLMYQLGSFWSKATLQWWVANPETLAGTWIQAFFAAVFATFRGVYQLMPFLFGPEYEANKTRALYFDPQTYSDLGWVSASQLAFAEGTWQALMKDPKTVPPRQVLRCVAGISNSTAQYVGLDPSGKPLRGSWIPGQGDSVVTVPEATIGSEPAYTIIASHREIPKVMAGNGELAELILDNGVIPDPPPPPIRLPAPGGATAPGILDLLRPPTGVAAKDC